MADQQTEIDRIERRFSLRLGRLVERLEALEVEVDHYRQELQRRQNIEAYDAGYLPVEEQYRRAWYQPPEDPAASKPASPLTDEKQIKRLYRQLARRYHPDLASDPDERAFRTERMAALNEAYEARSMIELIALGNDVDTQSISGQQQDQTTRKMINVLEDELAQVRRRQEQIKHQLETLHLHPAVRLSLDVKLARRSGRDLMGEMAANISRKIVTMKDERDRLKERLGI